jgi:DNA invertase Pin-like site-specific DNA recombinase
MISKTRRVALYARVSTDSQTTESQLVELRAVAARAGWEVVAERGQGRERQQGP